MDRKDYPLIQVLEIKQRRVDTAEQVVKEKKALLEQEEEKLKQRELERDKVQTHYKNKLQQLREELDRNTTTDKIQQMKVYIKIVFEKLQAENKKVEEQKTRVAAAQKELDDAKQVLKLKRLEVDKVQSHRALWEKMKNREDEIQDEKAMDELGTLTFTTKHLKQEPRIEI